MSYTIPSSRPEDWAAALKGTAQLAEKCPIGHPLHMWRDRTEQLLTQRGLDPKDADDLAERFVVPASYLCRLARSLAHGDALGPRLKSELAQINDLDGFMHLEYMLYLGARFVSHGLTVAAVGRRLGEGKTPDLEVAEHNYAIECTARGPKSPRAVLASDFEHADQKFRHWLPRAERRGYLGVLATDLGVCGSPSLPNCGRLGPVLAAMDADISRGFEAFPSVSAVLITWTGIERAEEAGRLSLGLTACSGWRTRDPAIRLSGITDVFAPWAAQRAEVAQRTARDGRDPRR